MVGVKELSVHRLFRLHDEGPARSSYPTLVKPTTRLRLEHPSAVAVGPAPLIRRSRAHTRSSAGPCRWRRGGGATELPLLLRCSACIDREE